MNKDSNANMSDRDWNDKGKSDAWEGKPKQPPEHDPQAASMYDLGYCEGEIERSPVERKNNL
jgi:hypothetical protein